MYLEIKNPRIRTFTYPGEPENLIFIPTGHEGTYMVVFLTPWETTHIGNFTLTEIKEKYNIDLENGTVRIKHTDGKTDVDATVIFTNKEIRLEWIFQDNPYEKDVNIREAVHMGIIECPHLSIVPNLGFENSINGDICLDCNKIFK